MTLSIDVDGIDVSNDEAILHEGAAVGYISSGGYAHHVCRSMAMGYVPADLASGGKSSRLKSWVRCIVLRCRLCRSMILMGSKCGVNDQARAAMWACLICV